MFISDEPLLTDFFYSLSDQSMYRRFFSIRKNVPHEMRQQFVIIDYTKKIVIVAVLKEDEKEVIGIGQYGIHEDEHTVVVALVVKDDYQNKGIGTELLSYLTYLAKKQELLGFYAEVFFENAPMLYLFEKMGFDTQKKRGIGVYELTMWFK